MTLPAMTGLYPTGAGRLQGEVEAAGAPWAAIVGASANEGRLGTPGERFLLGSESLKVADDFVDGACMGSLHGVLI